MHSKIIIEKSAAYLFIYLFLWRN